MSTDTQPKPYPGLIDKAELREKFTELHKRMGTVYDPTATAEHAQQLMREQGIRPEDNSATRELLRMRYGGDYNPEK